MGKVSAEDKMRIQTLHEQGLGYRVIAAKYPHKQWNVNMVKAICKRVDETGSAVIRKPGSGRPKTVRTSENIKNVSEMISSQKNQPGTSKSTRMIAEEYWTFIDRLFSKLLNVIFTCLHFAAFLRKSSPKPWNKNVINAARNSSVVCHWQKQRRFSSLTKKNPPVNHQKTVFGLRVRRETFMNVGW